VIIQAHNSTTLQSIGSRLKGRHLVWGPWTRLGTTRSVKYLLQGKNIRFKDDRALFQGILWRSLMAVTKSMVLDGHTLDVELESELCLSLIRPIPQGLCGHTCDDLGRLINVQVFAGVIDVRFELFHPDTQRHFVSQFKDDDWGPDRGFQVHPCDQADGFFNESEV